VNLDDTAAAEGVEEIVGGLQVTFHLGMYRESQLSLGRFAFD
jgi:hypothetical protein